MSSRPFKVTSEEIRRYRNFNVPLPRWAYDERMYARMARAGDIRLYERSCDKTGKALRTCHPPDAPYPVWNRDEFEREMT